MKTIRYTSIFILSMGSLLAACSSSTQKIDSAKEKVEEASKDLDQAKADYQTEYQNFRTESDKRILDNEKEIAELKAHTALLKKEAKSDYEKKILEIENRNLTMREKMNAYRNDSKDQWEAFKREFNADMDALGQSLKDMSKSNSK